MNIELPSYIEKEAWDGFVEMRLKIKKPLTERAVKMIIKELEKIRLAGYCPNESLDQSNINCWRDVYQPKEKKLEKKMSSQADETAKYLADQKRAFEASKQSNRPKLVISR